MGLNAHTPSAWPEPVDNKMVNAMQIDFCSVDSNAPEGFRVTGSIRLVDGRVVASDENLEQFIAEWVVVKPGELERGAVTPADGLEYMQAVPYNLRGMFPETASLPLQVVVTMDRCPDRSRRSRRQRSASGRSRRRSRGQNPEAPYVQKRTCPLGPRSSERTCLRRRCSKASAAASCSNHPWELPFVKCEPVRLV